MGGYLSLMTALDKNMRLYLKNNQSKQDWEWLKDKAPA
jgi:hypothetical protein